MDRRDTLCFATNPDRRFRDWRAEVAGKIGTIDPLKLLVFSQEDADYAAMLDVLVAVVPRWRSAYLSLDSLSFLPRIPPYALESLQDLTLRLPVWGDDHTTAAFLNAARLRHINIQCTTQQIRTLRMPWSQLSNISLKGPSLEACLAALTQCKNIVSAKFEAAAWTTVPSLTNIEITTLGQLQDLTLELWEGWQLMPFFAHLALPGLTSLTLYLGYDLKWISTEFTKFQERSPHLQSFTIHGGEIGSISLLEALRHAPSLTRLSLHNCMSCFDDALISGLHYSGENTTVAPKLESLSVLHGETHVDEDSLIAMIRSRWCISPNIARWSRIYIDLINLNDASGAHLELRAERMVQGLYIDVSVESEM
ncbi:hypothetical protein B0H15DRAFT_1018478 [Mycena belliarum]|uniref:Uncharacterized protein n=1 Tax=Mycena belliarum TaxID=1033014 RepID=A0AAD6UL07_9AGAR|nr:hypothetical protein B0H15DRAFT_1018478 [Mycena belliae]